MTQEEFIAKIKTAHNRIEKGEPFDDIIDNDDIAIMISSLNKTMTTMFHNGLQPYVDEELIDPLSCRYLKDHIILPPVGSIVDLDEDAEMFSVCGVDWLEGVDGGVVLIKGKTKWLELIGF